MSSQLKYAFSDIPELNQPVTIELISKLNVLCATFETKQNHGAVFNSPLLGVEKAFFVKSDYQNMYDIFQVDPKDISRAIRTCDYIDPSWKVLNDPYNHLVVYIAHRIHSSKLPSDTVTLGIVNLFKLLQYKFFTSYVHQAYEFHANREVMQATIDGLSNKFDLVSAKTWKNLITSRAVRMSQPDSNYYEALRDYSPDYRVCRVISDTQTGLKKLLIRVTQLYYENFEEGNKISTYSSVDSLDGQKIIVSQTDTLDTMEQSMRAMIQNSSRLIDMELVNVLCNKFRYVHPEAMKKFLIMVAEKSAEQVDSGTFDTIKTPKNDTPYYVGLGKIVQEILRVTYRACVVDNVNMNSKQAIVVKAMNMYSSSRISDSGVLTIKRSVLKFVEECDLSSRENTNASFVLIFILYILIKSFDYI